MYHEGNLIRSLKAVIKAFASLASVIGFLMNMRPSASRGKAFVHFAVRRRNSFRSVQYADHVLLFASAMFPNVIGTTLCKTLPSALHAPGERTIFLPLVDDVAWHVRCIHLIQIVQRFFVIRVISPSGPAVIVTNLSQWHQWFQHPARLRLVVALCIYALPALPLDLAISMLHASRAGMWLVNSVCFVGAFLLNLVSSIFVLATLASQHDPVAFAMRYRLHMCQCSVVRCVQISHFGAQSTLLWTNAHLVCAKFMLHHCVVLSVTALLTHRAPPLSPWHCTPVLEKIVPNL